MNMAQEYIESRFCKSIKRLIYMGTWPPDMITNPKHQIIFYAYAFLWQFAMVSAIVIQHIDLYFVLGNLKKMTFNLCSSAIVLGIFIKMSLLVTKRKKLTKIIYKLWEDSSKCNTEEDITFLNGAYDKMNFVRKILYSGVICVVSIMSGGCYFSYKWGERMLPFAGYFPMDDMNNDLTYVPALLFEFVMGLYAAITVLESDVMMLTLVSQIQAHYKILFKNLKKLDEICETRQINRNQKDNKIMKYLKALVKRHMELLKYCEEVEHIFHSCMFVQILGGFILILMNGVETARQMNQISLSLGYQMLFVLTVTFDLYIICYNFTALETECINASFAAYNTKWYDMDIRVRKMLCLIMTRAQIPPRFTFGKLLKIDLNSYMHVLKNIYSWLMVFRQLDMK